MYLAEAHCMVGRYEEAMAHLNQTEQMIEENPKESDPAKQLVKQVE